MRFTAALERDRKRRSEEKSHSEVQARFASLTPREPPDHGNW